MLFKLTNSERAGTSVLLLTPVRLDGEIDSLRRFAASVAMVTGAGKIPAGAAALAAAASSRTAGPVNASAVSVIIWRDYEELQGTRCLVCESQSRC